ncbi:hypothetical protein [Merismopedia glauca]|uniref:Uncharacterized protein n=1 Tax=Merismopedia glauca CCAP 1448/3 TaxID=1296344 RepID=A0A2T1CA63_9CYAN|nr:hypothetical protein [Merismopedia glauca]PSB05165.1 hypothetical protein C7B64_00525 [Merismopedia glauca CCAP 1448/3]
MSNLFTPRNNQISSKITRLIFHVSLHLWKREKQSEQGYILFVVVGVMLVLQALLMAYIVAAKIEKSTSEASVNSNSSFYGAEGGLNLRAEKIRQKFLLITLPNGQGSQNPPASTADCLDEESSNNGNGDFQCLVYKIGGKNIISYVNDLNNQDAVTQQPIPRRVTIPPGELFEDLAALEYRYKIVADAQPEYCDPQQLASIPEKDRPDCSQESKQEMLIKIRNVPLFQFAAFYKNDMEFHPGSKMVINGPVHSNGSIYFGAQKADPDNLKIMGQVSAVGDAYSRRKSEDTTFSSDRTTLCKYNASLPDGQDCQALHDSSYTDSLLSLIDRTYIKNRWGNRLKVGVKNIKVPEPSFLNKNGDYHAQADLRIQFNPAASGANLPFAVQSINRNNGQIVILQPGQLQSLRQPVITNFCSSVPNELTGIPTDLNTPERKEAIAKALKVSIASIKVSEVPLKYGTELTSSLNTLYSGGVGKIHTVKDNIINALVATGLDNGTATNHWNNTIKDWNPNDVAGLRTTSSLNGGCFVASPLSVNQFYNSREDRQIQVLQFNMKALTIWNKDGVYVEFTGNDPSNNNSGNGFSSNQALFTLYDADNNSSNGIQGDSTAANGSFQKLGYAAADRTEGGLVIHATVDETVADVNTNQSPYGFVVTNGQELPGLSTTSSVTDPTGLTIASDQAVYLQGDYNTINKQPASVLTDSINVLSNACLNTTTNLLNCGNHTGLKTTRTAPAATATKIQAAFLSGTDISQTGVPNGGLHNYPRLHENWSGITLTYYGSLVSLGTPQHVSGAWTDNQNWAYTNPKRDYNYDRYFDAYENLPPMTPNLVYLRQEVFSRKFLR